MSTEGGTRAIVAAFLANFAIAIAKFVAFLFTGASSMLAESIHSVADTGNQALLALGGRKAKRAPDTLHPFGFGRERYFYAFLVAVVLFTLGSLFALYEGYEKLRHPHELGSPVWAFAVLAFALVAEAFSLRTAVKESNRIRHNQSWWRFIRRSRNPELPVVLLEDTGALIGLVFALIGITLATVTGDARWDAVGSLAIGLLLGVIAVIVGTEMRSLLVGESATKEETSRIMTVLAGATGVHRLIHLRTMHLGPEELLVAAKLELEDGKSFADVAETIQAVQRRLRDEIPTARVVYLEPDVYRPERSGEPHKGAAVPEDVGARTGPAEADRLRGPAGRTGAVEDGAAPRTARDAKRP